MSEENEIESTNDNLNPELQSESESQEEKKELEESLEKPEELIHDVCGEDIGETLAEEIQNCDGEIEDSNEEDCVLKSELEDDLATEVTTEVDQENIQPKRGKGRPPKGEELPRVIKPEKEVKPKPIREPEEKKELVTNKIKNNYVPFGDFDTCLEMGYRSNCDLCNSPFVKEAIFIWHECDKNPYAVNKWLYDKHKKRVVLRMTEAHFTNHIEPYFTEEMIEDERRLYDLTKKAAENTATNQIAQIKQMHWEYIQDNYKAKPKKIDKDPAAKRDHKELSKQFTELVKSYKDVVMMEWEMMGQGKSEEEQREIMKNFVINSLKKNIEEIKAFPEAYSKLAEKLGLQAPASLGYTEEGKITGDTE